MLNRVHLKNFKLHADTSIEGAPITVFIGPNSSGKSSIFQALLLWRQAAERNSPDLCSRPGVNPTERQPYLFEADQLIDAGDFGHIVRRGEREVLIAIEGDLPRSHIEFGPGITTANISVQVRENRVVRHTGNLAYWIESRNASGRKAWSWPANPNIGAPGDYISLGAFSLRIEPTQSFALLAGPLISWGNQVVSHQEQLAVQDFAGNVSRAPEQLLASLHPVFPLRGFEESGYPLPDAPAETLDRMALQDRTIALLSVLAYNRDVERRISAWLADLAGIRIEVKLLPGKRVTLLCANSGEGISSSLFSNEGTGAAQLPFMLVPIGLTPPGETILLSEPEVHLHPRYQSELTRLLVKLTKNEKRQFFIETHSEHVLHALLNLVAKREISTSDLAIYYFDKRDGKAVCERLQIDERGGVAGGLPGFFDQSLGELAEYLGTSQPK